MISPCCWRLLTAGPTGEYNIGSKRKNGGRVRMALVNLETTLQKVCIALTKLTPPQGLEILSYKRNRGITILRLDDQTFLVRERGYEEFECRVSAADLPKLLKSMMKREFPRSRKVRIYRLSGPEAIGLPRKKL